MYRYIENLLPSININKSNIYYAQTINVIEREKNCIS